MIYSYNYKGKTNVGPWAGITTPYLYLTDELGCVCLPISQIPQWLRQILHNEPFCNRNVHTCPHFSYIMVHCGIQDLCIVGFAQQVYCEYCKKCDRDTHYIVKMFVSFFQSSSGNTGEVERVKLVLHGTREMPHHVKINGHRKYRFDPSMVNTGKEQVIAEKMIICSWREACIHMAIWFSVCQLTARKFCYTSFDTFDTRTHLKMRVILYRQRVTKLTPGLGYR